MSIYLWFPPPFLGFFTEFLKNQSLFTQFFGNFILSSEGERAETTQLHKQSWILFKNLVTCQKLGWSTYSYTQKSWLYIPRSYLFHSLVTVTMILCPCTLARKYTNEVNPCLHALLLNKNITHQKSWVIYNSIWLAIWLPNFEIFKQSNALSKIIIKPLVPCVYGLPANSIVFATNVPKS